MTANSAPIFHDSQSALENASKTQVNKREKDINTKLEIHLQGQNGPNG